MRNELTMDETEIVAGRAACLEVAHHEWRVLAILSLLMAFASISTDLYLPAMPQIALSLGASQGTIEWTVSGYLIGFSFGQLFWGPIGDRYGRRLPIIAGITLFAIGSAGCAMAESAWIMIGWRIVQALGACAGVVLSRAMVRDLYKGAQAARMLSTLITVMAIAPLIGPGLGGQILAIAGWRAIFWILVGIGIMTIAAVMTLPETLPDDFRNREPLGQALSDYMELLKDRRLLAYAGAGAGFLGGVYANVAGTPFAYIAYYHVAPQLYGILFALGIVGMMATNTINARIVGKVGIVKMLSYGAALLALSSLFLAVISFTDFGGLWGLVIPTLVYVGVNGFVLANSIAGALANFPERAGAVSALVGSTQYGAGIIGSACVGFFANGTPWPMGAVMAVMGIGSFLCAKTLVNKSLPSRRNI